MNALDVLCAQLTRDLFAIAKLLLTIGRLLLHYWYSLGRHVTIGTPMVIFAIFAVFWLFWLFLTNGTLNQSSKTLKTIGVRIVTDLPRLYQQCTNGVPIIKNSQKTVKPAKMTIGVPIVTGLPRQSNSKKNDHWCTNHYMSTQSPPNTQSRANAATLRNLHHMCLGQ